MTRPVDLHQDEHGDVDAPAVLLVGSLGSTLATWDPQLPALTPRYRVVRADLRGHGGSPVPPGPYSVADLGADLLALLDRVGIDRAHVVGLSLGGMAAMQLAAGHPDRVGRLVLCSTSPKLGSPDDWRQRAATVRAHGTEAVADAVVGRWFTSDYAQAHPDLVARMRRMVVDTPDEGYAACCEAIAEMDLRDALDRVSAATLVIGGSDDPATPPADAHDLAGRIHGARADVLEPAAHLLNVQQPEAFAELLMAHLDADEEHAGDRSI